MSTNVRDRNLEHLHPVLRHKIALTLKRLAEAKAPFRIFEGYRSPERQARLFAQGRTARGPVVTYARPWHSYHQYGLAVDLVLWVRGRWSWEDRGAFKSWWELLHEVGRDVGLEPLDFEQPHLQLPGVSLAELQRGRYPAGGDESWAHNLQAAIAAWRSHPAVPPAPGL